MKLKNRLDISYEEMTQALEKGEMQIHKFPLGFIVTEIKQADERLLHVVWLGGEEFDSWKEEAWEVLSQFAKKHGCKAISAHCRPGLAEALKPLGFRTIKITVRAQV